MGHNLIIIKYRVIHLAIHVHFVSCNVSPKFHVNIWDVFLIMDMVNIFAQISELNKSAAERMPTLVCIFKVEKGP